jgi:peptidoglycan/LPS O-acetylase OafA/YrhL
MLRFFAISLVVYQHGMFLYYPYINQTLANIQLSLFGYWGVELFFVLSGFLIGRIFIQSFCREEHFGLGQLFFFWKRRWLRTLPNYYFMLLYIFIRGGTFAQLAAYFLFMQNFAWPNDPFYLQAWSLSIEEWFYLSFPIVALLSATFLTKRIGKKNTLLFVIVLYIVASNALRIGAYSLFNTSILEMNQTTIFRLDSIMYGVFISWLISFYQSVLQQNLRIITAVSLLLFSVTFVLHLKFVLVAEPSEWVYILELFLTPLSFCMLLPYFVFKSFRLNHRLQQLITIVSMVSYSIYLNHYFVLLPIGKWINPTSALAGIFCFLILSILVFIISIFQYKLIEEPFMKLREHRYFKLKKV